MKNEINENKALSQASVSGCFFYENLQLEDLENEDLDTLKFYIERHLKYTNSDVAKNILDNWEITSKYFIKVMPTDYKKVLAERKSKAETIKV